MILVDTKSRLAVVEGRRSLGKLGGEFAWLTGPWGPVCQGTCVMRNRRTSLLEPGSWKGVISGRGAQGPRAGRYRYGSGFVSLLRYYYFPEHRLSASSKPWHAALFNKWVIRRKRENKNILFFYTQYNIGYPNIQKQKNRHRTYTPSPNITPSPTTPAIA